MKSPRYDLLDSDRARITEEYVFKTTVKGYSAEWDEPGEQCELRSYGLLIIKPGFVYDFASGAIDTPDMVVASLAHDALCRLTDRGLIPWEARAKSDKYFRQLLKQLGTPFFRRWYAYLAVRAYSVTLAKKRRA